MRKVKPFNAPEETFLVIKVPLIFFVSSDLLHYYIMDSISAIFAVITHDFVFYNE